MKGSGTLSLRLPLILMAFVISFVALVVAMIESSSYAVMVQALIGTGFIPTGHMMCGVGSVVGR
jgi:hypothetical protein